MHSSSALLLNLAIVPAAYFYGTGGLTVQGVRQWLFNSNTEEAKAAAASSVLTTTPGSNITTTTTSHQEVGGSTGGGGASSSSDHDGGDYVCLHNPPDMRPIFLSYEPIMVYLENFVTEYEREYLVRLASPLYEPSELRQYDTASGTKQATVDRAHRLSETAWLPSADPVVSCVRARAASFQGHAPNATLDSLAALRYHKGGKFGLHHDWDSARVKEYDRRTSFFVTLAADPPDDAATDAAEVDASVKEGQGQEKKELRGGSTWFPFVKFAWTNSKTYGRPWCQWVDCDFRGGEEGLKEWGGVEQSAAAGGGVAVKPIAGNAVFWVNFKDDGTGIHETLHAGEPIVSGTKIGMNIWTWSMIGADGGGIPEE